MVTGSECEEGAMPAQWLTGAQRLRRVFRTDVETCPKCGGAMKIIACIDEEVMEKILAHVDAKVLQPEAAMLRPSRAPPQLKWNDPGSTDTFCHSMGIF